MLITLLLGRARLRGPIELLDRFGGEVDPGLGPDHTRVLHAQEHLQLFLLRELLEQREEPLLKFSLQFLRELVDLGLRILLEALSLAGNYY